MTVPQTVGVAGGGRMGVGIAHAFLLAGADVVVLERDAEAAAGALARLERAVASSVERGTTARTARELLSHARVTTSVEEIRAAGLVVEAVPEDLATKADVLTRVEKHLSPAAWLASNTSSLSIDAIAGHLVRPERFVGLHFFNPVPVSALVEIVRGRATDPALVAAAGQWVAAVGKTSIVVRDSPGFASSRLGVAIGLEAIRMLEDGVASAEDIDTAMVLGYKFPVGPLRLTDIVGLDVRLGIAEHLERELGERFAVPPLLRAMVAEGRLGRKSGEGFFRWDQTDERSQLRGQGHDRD
jgi:3-hydroxybutyryl-CoA dehydrogenase